MGNRAGAWTRTLWLRGNGRCNTVCNTVHSSSKDHRQVILLLPWLLENHVSGDNKTRWNTSTRKCITKGHLTLTKHPDLSTHASAIVSAFTVARQGINIPMINKCLSLILVPFPNDKLTTVQDFICWFLHRIALSQNLSVKLQFFYELRIYSRSSKGTKAAPPYWSNSINTAEFWSFRQIPSATQSEYSSPGKSCGCTCYWRSRFAKMAKRSRRVTRKPCPRCGSILLSRQGRGSA